MSPDPRAKDASRLTQLAAALRPEPDTWRAATRVTAWGAAIFWALAMIFELWDGSWRYGVNIVALGVIPFLLALVTGLVALLVRWLGRSPTTWLWAFVTALGFFAAELFLGGPVVGILIAVGLALALGLVGGGVAVLRAGGRNANLRGGAALVVGGGALAALAGVMIWSGATEAEPPNAAGQPSALVPTLVLPDPAAAGTFKVGRLTYGSGADRHREEFGARVTLKTTSFDGSRLIGQWKGRSGWARTRFYGFDATRLPLQAWVYYPEGPGPFPLVLAVHGNHSMEDWSDPGYGYLGELLASRGILFASVDESFLNSSISDIIGFPKAGLDEENDARGVVLLEHLKAWRGFNADPGNPFHGKVDLNRVALIGHSRGGEAVSVAAAFNRLPADPDDARIKFDYGFGLRAVVAIAQVDGQYKPANQGTPIRDVSFLALHGSYDGDVTNFDGSRQWSRVSFSPDTFRFKAQVYVHGANHGQFNTTWGRDDNGGLRGRLLNQAAIMPGDAQRRVAQVYISAFLEATLRDRREYLPLFQDSRAGADWLPKGIILARLATSADQVVSSYGEDINLATTTIPGGSIVGANLADWKERLVPLKSGDQATRAVFLGWNKEEWPKDTARYEIVLPDAGLVTSGTTELVFDLADARQEPSPRDPDKPKAETAKTNKKDKDRKESKADTALKQPIDFTVELEDRDGHIARDALSAVRGVQRQLEARVLKLPFLSDEANSELVFQTIGFPLRAFEGVDPGRLRALRLLFNRSIKGVVALGRVAFR